MTSKEFGKKKVIISLLLYIAVIAVNYSSAMGIINGMSQKAVSANYPTMITPAGFAFAIWGVIYLFILAALLLPFFKGRLNIKTLNKISVSFWVSCFINIAWTFAFSYNLIWLSAILIVALFINILIILIQIKIVRGREKNFFDVGFGLYGGWLCIASVVNFVAFLVSVKFDFWGNEKLFYTVLLVLFIIIAALFQKIHENPFFNLSIVWAFFAIIVKSGFGSYLDPMFLVLALGMAILFALSVLSFRKIRFRI